MIEQKVMGVAEMSLRDWFAGKAMQALIGTVWGQADEISWENIAKASYRQADAMLAEKERCDK